MTRALRRPLKRLSEGSARSASGAPPAAGIYISVGFGFLGTLFAARQLGPEDFGLLAVVVVATGFFQSLLDTAEEALVKYGFDYATGSRGAAYGDCSGRRFWSRLPGASRQGSCSSRSRRPPTRSSAAPTSPSRSSSLPCCRCCRAPRASPALRSSSERYDIRAWLLASSMGLRMTGLAVGAHFGVTEAVVGIVLAQAVATVLATTALAAFRRFPAAAPCGSTRMPPGILRFVFHSSLATGVVSLRGALAPLLLGIVSKPVQVGFFRIAQAPQQGLASLSAPARLIMLTEQTRDWARGATAVVFAAFAASWAALLMALIVPPVYILMPWLVRVLYGEDYEGASDAARLVLLAAALQFVFGWSKSLPVSIGRPGLRVIAHGIESVVMIPLVVVLGREWGATGCGGGARLDSRLLRDLGRPARADSRRDAVKVLIVSGIWPPDVGGPASHAPELAAHLRSKATRWRS